MTSRRTRVAVVFGGRSSEHAISCVSAGGVLAAMDRSKYDVLAIGITTAGMWVRQPDDPESMRIEGDHLPEVKADGDAAVLSLNPEKHGFWFQPESGQAYWEPVDVVFPVLHGPNGEDGSIQGMLELAGIPFVGSGVFASSACMDKGHTKTILSAAGLPAGSWHPFHAQTWHEGREGVLRQASGLGWPMFVKPARAGSSMGVSKAHDEGQLHGAVAAAIEHDPRVVLEASVESAREIECGVLGRADGTVSASVCAEIKVRGQHEFYDFEAKYLDDAAELVVPAELSDVQLKMIQDLAVAAFEALGCEGLARVDFFLTTDGNVVINEVNTMPGFTPISMYPRMWSESGVDYANLIDELIGQGLARGVGLR